MKGLKEAIGRRTNPVAHDFSVPPAIAKAEAVVLRLIGEVQVREPNRVNLDELHRTVEQLWATKTRFDHLTSRQRSDLPWIVFYPPEVPPSEWLGADAAFARALLKVVESHPRSSTVSKLINVWLRRFPAALTTFGLWASGIQRLLQQTKKPSLNRWRERADEMPLFAPTGPNGLASRLVGAKTSIDDTLSQYGFEGTLATGEFVRFAGHELVKVARDQFTTEANGIRHVERLADFVMTRGRVMRFADLKRPAVEAMLEPFIDRSPDPDLQDRVTRLVLSMVKDPRIAPSSWQGISQDARTVMFRWLVADTLEQFFAIVSQTTRVDRHWQDREQFWRGY